MSVDINEGTLDCTVKFPAKGMGHAGFQCVVQYPGEKYPESAPLKCWEWKGNGDALALLGTVGATVRITYRLRNGKGAKTSADGKAIYETYLEPTSIEPTGAKVAETPKPAPAPRRDPEPPQPDDDLPF